MIRAIRGQIGFTLIELLVGMAIALVMLLATAGVFINTKKAFAFQNAQSEIAQEGRFGVDMIRRLIGQAGYRAPVTTITSNTANVVPAAVSSTPPFTRAVDYFAASNSLVLRFQSDGSQIGCDGAQIAATTSLQSNWYEVWLTFDSTNNVLTCGVSNEVNATSATPPTTWMTKPIDLIGTSDSTNNPSPIKVDSFSPQFGFDTSQNGALAAGAVGCSYPSNQSGDCLAKAYVNASALNAAPYNATPYEMERVVTVRVCIQVETTSNVLPVGQSYSYLACDGTVTTGKTSSTSSTLIRSITATARLRNLVNA